MLVEGLSPELVETELIGHGQCLLADTDRVLAAAGEHPEARDIGR